MKNLNIAVLASGNGTIIPEIIKEFEIKLVVSNKSNAPVLENAAKLGIKSIYTSNEDEISKILQEHNIDLILAIGYMKILSPKFVATWRNKILNVHPSLLPKFAGLMNLKVHAAVLKAGEKQTGCTVHFVDEILDGGKIIVQKTCEVAPNDTPETLKNKVQKLEGPAMVEAIKIFGENYASCPY
jgi:phosphoribosylglycinamide formyltransferase-1